MNLSRKIILSSCACAALLTGVYSCTVDERNIEDKDVFVCLIDADCLSPDSVCAGGDGSTVTGRCRAKNQLDPCADYDGDGYMGVDRKWLEINADQGGSAQCGNPVDIDDTDPDVHPGATEYCDGKDNNGDGCVDGKCMCEESNGNCNCDGRKDLCAALTENCIGRKNINKMASTAVCAPEVAGVMFCKSEANKGVWVYGKATGKTGGSGKFYQFSDFEEVSGSQCPTAKTNSGNDKIQVYTINGKDYSYVENEVTLIKSSTELAALLCGDEDHDCNGKSGTEEGGTSCRSCSDTLSDYAADQRDCLVFSGNSTTTLNTINKYQKDTSGAMKENSDYSSYTETFFGDKSPRSACSTKSINDGTCACMGTLGCAEGGKTIVCMKDGKPIVAETIHTDFNTKGTIGSSKGWCEIVQ